MYSDGSMSIVADNKTLRELCHRLSQGRYVAVDTEFMRENTFWSKLCLVQLAGLDDAAVVDPLEKDLDLSPLDDLMKNPDLLKVFHAGRQDLEIFYKRMGVLPSPIFDTQISAMVCGFGDAASYETLASKLAGAHIDKLSRFTDWSKRPLSTRQLQYALNDVIHMRPIFEKLELRLEKTGRGEWIRCEMDKLRDTTTYDLKPEDAWKRIKLRNPTPLLVATIQEVAAWREIEAQKLDVPRNRILRDESLVEIAAHLPSETDDLLRIRGISKSLSQSVRGAELLKAVRRAKDLPQHVLPQIQKVKTATRKGGPLIDLLKVLLKLRCDEHKVGERIIASVADLNRIAFDTEADVPALKGWRYDVFGRDALDLKNGKTSIGIKNGKLQVTCNN